ncbi:MAG TPA: hypothetical protein VNM90_20405 [Haliangium sp.]|nr:hypothetical protein [Haliangium sp.]
MSTSKDSSRPRNPARRRSLQTLSGLAIGFAVAPSAMAGPRAKKGALPVVRISRGSFAPESYEAVKQRLDASRKGLVPAIKKLRGLLHYYVGIDPVSNTMINVSVWKTLDHAKQMDTLQAMRDLAGEFIAAGVTFERPISNYETLWEI